MYITIVTKEGQRDLVSLPDNRASNLTDLLNEKGYLAPGICRGSEGCIACHIHVIARLEKLPEASEREMDMLDKLQGRQPNSRMACQISLNEDMNGIVIKLTRK